MVIHKLQNFGLKAVWFHQTFEVEDKMLKSALEKLMLVDHT